VVVAAGLLLVLVGRGAPETKPAIGSVGPAQEPTAGQPSATPPPAPSQAAGPAPGERSVIIPGSAKPVTASRPNSSVPDISELLGANSLATTKTTLRLLDRVGGQQVIGVVPKGEAVVIRKLAGEWALVQYVDKGRAFSGWTIRNLIE
jgi:hypothetical protein